MNQLFGKTFWMVTLLAVALYIAIRNAPVESCEILHYDDFINKDGVIEYCGDEETVFFDLNEIRFPIEMKIESEDVILLNEKRLIQFELTNYRDEPIRADRIAVSHTRKLHLLIVNEKLTDYQHVHPLEDPLSPGSYSFEFTPRTSGPYALYLDFISIESGRRVIASSSLEVSGFGLEPAEGFSESESPIIFVERNDLFQTDTSNVLTIKPKVEGEEFEEVMGALAHLVLFHPEKKGFAHIHPLPMDTTIPFSENHPLRFEFYPETPGDYVLWVQMKRSGKDLFIPYSVRVRSQ